MSAPNITLLTGYPNIPGVVLASSSTSSEAACAAVCLQTPCCRGYTWHDQSTGIYFKDCFVLTDPDADPWNTSAVYSGHQSGLCNTTTARNECQLPDFCTSANVVCSDPTSPSGLNTTLVDGVVGKTTAASAALVHAGRVPVSECLEHVLGLANDWPHWTAQSYGALRSTAAAAAVAGGSDSSYDPLSKLDTDNNFPLWYGPWTSGILVDTTQDAGAGIDLASYTWADASSIVVHAMADGEWGGTQFRVANASRPPTASANATLAFSHGGFQQARGATLTGKNRFYMEGSVEFLDQPGEWHYDACLLYTSPSPRDRG